MTTPISDEEIDDIVFPRSAFEDLPRQTWERACLRLCARVRTDAATIARQSAELAALRVVAEAATTLHRRDEWHEDDGAVVWWTLPVEEPPYVGTLLDEDIPDYVTHWTRLVVPALSALDAATKAGALGIPDPEGA